MSDNPVMPGLLVAFCLFLQADPVRLIPVDDASRDSAFHSYVRKLQSAVESRNAGALRKLVADDVLVGPGDEDKGWAKFAAKWRPDAGATSPLWSALADLLSLGFIREHPVVYLSPYLVWRFPRELSMATHLVVIRDHAILREQPSLRAASVAVLSFDIVRRLDESSVRDELIEWVHVRTFSGQTGYLNSRDAMSPIMPRAQFGLQRGRWVMTALETP
jgi:hypothetical protein